MKPSILAVLAVFAARPAEAVKIGAELVGGVSVPAGTYMTHKGSEFDQNMGGGARVSLLLGKSWLFSYGFTLLTNNEVCTAGCFDGSYGSTKLHSFSAGYRLHFLNKAIRPYVGLGLGGVVGSLGGWPTTSGTSSSVFGGEASGSLGVELKFLKKYFAVLEPRYRYMVTNNPLRDETQDVVYAAFIGSDPDESQFIQDAHTIDVFVGAGGRF